jgi:hypothetical protein
MTTELATRPASPWSDWDDKMAFARELVGTGFCPSAIKTPAQALAIILTGQELGIPPMHALRSIHVIEGKPTLSAELMLALMLKGGVQITWVRSDDDGASLAAKRGNTAFTGMFTLEEAKRAGLTSKIAWRIYPGAMLRARVISLVARVVAPDLIAGLYTAEELGADVDAEGAIMSEPSVATTPPPLEHLDDPEMTETPTDSDPEPQPWEILSSDYVARFDEATTRAEAEEWRLRWLKAKDTVPTEGQTVVQQAIARARKRLT